jgi:GNAT superfamily N-acetyltransferase
VTAVSSLEARRDAFAISTDPARLDLDVVHGFLARSYWAEGRPREVVARSIQHSLCFGLYRVEPAPERQVGFTRVVTDCATFAWVCDVFVLEEERGKGLSKWLIETVRAHPDLQGLRRWILATRDAHRLYARFGFTPLAEPTRYMEVLDRDVYRRTSKA